MIKNKKLFLAIQLLKKNANVLNFNVHNQFNLIILLPDNILQWLLKKIMYDKNNMYIVHLNQKKQNKS